MQPGRLTLLLLILPGAGFIFLFLAAAIAMTFLQSIGLYSLVGKSRLTGEYWLSLLDRTFLDSFLFSLRVGIGSAFGTLLFAYPLALFLRRQRFGARIIGSIVKVPLFVPALVAAFLILNMLAFNGVLNSALMCVGIIDRPMRMLNDKFGWNVLAIQIWKNLPFQLLIIASVLETIQHRHRGRRPQPRRQSAAGDLAHRAAAVDARHPDRRGAGLHPDLRRLRHHQGRRAGLSVLAVGADVHEGLHAAAMGRRRLHRHGHHRRPRSSSSRIYARAGARHRRRSADDRRRTPRCRRLPRRAGG